MNRILCIILLPLILTGCVSTAHSPISPERQAALQDQALAVSMRDAPSFYAFTAGKALFGLAGAAAMAAAGSSIVTENNIPDINEAIRTAMAAGLSEQYGVRVVPHDVITDDTSPAEVAAQYAAVAPYVVDVEGIESGFRYRPFDLTHYDVYYLGKARLIDTGSATLLAKASCIHSSKDQPNPPTRDQLLADNAARLKQALARLAEDCVAEYLDKFTGKVAQ